MSALAFCSQNDVFNDAIGFVCYSEILPQEKNEAYFTGAVVNLLLSVQSVL